MTETPTATARDLATQLAEWIKAEGIQSRYPADVLAGHMLTQFGESYITEWLATGNTSWLRGACERYIHPGDETPDQRWAEAWYHGHLKQDLRS